VKLVVAAPVADRDGYSTLHRWVQRHFERRGRCERCGHVGRTEWASIDHVYTRKREDWLELCKRCHADFDGVEPPRWNRGRTHCKRGHPYDEANTRLVYRDGRVIGRDCRTCKREAKQRERAAA
jgi:hypothetical protein